MTPSQSALKQYILEKMKDGSFKGITAPSEMLKKAILEVVADAPVALGDFLGGTVANVLVTKAGDLAREMSQRGVFTVLGELKETLAMQHQRGVERLRKQR